MILLPAFQEKKPKNKSGENRYQGNHEDIFENWTAF